MSNEIISSYERLITHGKKQSTQRYRLGFFFKLLNILAYQRQTPLFLLSDD